MAGKLKFAQNLYLGEGIAPEKLDKLKKRLNKKPLLAKVYLITPARIQADQLVFLMPDSWYSLIIRTKNFSFSVWLPATRMRCS